MGGPKVFNDSTITQSSTKREYQRRRLVARASEARRQLSVRRYFSVSLGGLLISGEQLDEIRAFEAATRQGMENFLVRLSTFHLLEDYDHRPAFLGVGNGTEQTFQVTKKTSYQGDEYSDVIRFLNWNYPEMRDLCEQEWFPMPETQVWRGLPVWNGEFWQGLEITDDCAIDRLTGQITGTQTGNLYVTGGFYWEMICPTGISVSPKGPYFEISEGVQFIEPFPVGGEL